MTISGERTDQLDIFCRVTGFTSDFLSFIDVVLIRFFHGAIQLSCIKLPVKFEYHCLVVVVERHLLCCLVLCILDSTCTCTLRFSSYFSRLTWVSGYQNVSILDYI